MTYRAVALSCALISSLAACAEDAPPDTTPTSGDKTPYWATNSVADEAGSTHLWIVDRALDALARRPDLPDAVTARARLTSPACTTRWRQGLYDADYRHQYNGGWFDLSPTSSTATIAASGATWQSHFYDPDTGKNYKGNTSPTAKTESIAHLANAKALLAANNVTDGCYELGLALHFMTDLTQPMHASNYTATDYPIHLHTNVEEYAIGLQTGAGNTSWSGPPAEALATFIDDAGHRSKNRWPALKATIAAAYGARCSPFSSYWFDHTDCWQNDASVNASIVDAMNAAIGDTASFLVIAQIR